MVRKLFEKVAADLLQERPDTLDEDRNWQDATEIGHWNIYS